MVFRMSYGAAPPAQAKAAPAPAAPASKKTASPRVRKTGSLKEKAEALFDPASATTKNDEAAG